ncbi:MAG: hypothetical protein WCI02_15945, partial [Planctomycetota bacterium]
SLPCSSPELWRLEEGGEIVSPNSRGDRMAGGRIFKREFGRGAIGGSFPGGWRVGRGPFIEPSFCGCGKETHTQSVGRPEPWDGSWWKPVVC